MKKLFLLIVLLLTGIYNYAAVVEGTVTNQSGMPVPNRDVFVSDSANSPGSILLQATTDANGYYNVGLPFALGAGTQLYVYTAGCNGMVAMNTYTYAGVDITSDFSVCTSTVPVTISGTVSLNPTTGAYPATVYLIGVQPDTINSSFELVLVDSTTTDAQGYYSMAYPNTYYYRLLTKAALQPSSPDYANYLPTYYSSSLTWDSATDITVLANPTGIVSWPLMQGVNPGGPGFIAGLVIQGANKTTGPGDPLNKKLMLLTDMNDVPVAYTYSDASGLFAFSNIAYGSYKLFGDVWGKLNPPLIVTLSASQPNVNNVEFEENSTSFDGHIGITGVGTIKSALSQITLFPNPVGDQLTVSGLDQISGTKTVTILHANGAVLFAADFSAGQKVVIPMSKAAAGLYIATIKTSEGTASFKIVK